MKKEVVHTKTLEEYKYVISKIDNNLHLNIFDYEIEKENTCINLVSGRYWSINHYRILGYKIISFEEFKSRYEPQLKIGDTFEHNGFVCRVESEVKKWYYNTRTDKYVRTKHYGRHLKEITNKEFIKQLEKYSK